MTRAYSALMEGTSVENQLQNKYLAKRRWNHTWDYDKGGIYPLQEWYL